MLGKTDYRPEDRSRRKPVACVLCSSETYDRHSLCSGCRWDAAIGKAYKESQVTAVVEGQQTIVRVPYLPDVWREPFNLVEADEHGRIRELGEILDRLLFLCNADHARLQKVVEAIAIGYGQNEQGLYHDPYFQIDADKVDTLNEIMDLCRMIYKSARAEGYRDGNSLLMRLASDDLTVAELEERQQRNQ